jgi:hypothetical protein
MERLNHLGRVAGNKLMAGGRLGSTRKSSGRGGGGSDAVVLTMRATDNEQAGGETAPLMVGRRCVMEYIRPSMHSDHGRTHQASDY